MRVEPIEAVLATCERQVEQILAEFEQPWAMHDAVVAGGPRWRISFAPLFDVIRTDQDLIRVREAYPEKDEVGFARLKELLTPACTASRSDCCAGAMGDAFRVCYREHARAWRLGITRVFRGAADEARAVDDLSW